LLVRIPRSIVSAALLAGLVALAPPAQAAPPERIWTERSWAGPIDPDAPISMRAFSRLAAELSPTVVFINVRRGGAPLPSVLAPPGGVSGLGTGFIINAEGFILTNYHVIRGSSEIEVKLASDRIHPAEVVGTYPQLDVALLKIEPSEPLAVAPLGDSDAVEIGEWVIAIGNPFGLNHTVTAGIVSAKGRRDVISSREPMFARFIQTDASINPGNSGGPLINIRGEVIGINTAINAAGQGIGFAVPVNMVKTILPQLATGRVSRSYLGVRVGPVARELAQRLALPRAMGALVREVLKGTPADMAGVQPGDVIVRWNGEAVEHWEDLPWLASTSGSGQAVTMTVNRSGEELDLPVQLASFPDEGGPMSSAPTPRAPRAGVHMVDDIGLGVSEVSAEIRSGLGLAADEGVVVAEVTAPGHAHSLGIQPGDVITQVNYGAVRGVEGFARAVAAVARGEVLSFTIRRDNRYLFKAMSR